MRHKPHVFVAGPWRGPLLELSDLQQHHLLKVLRLKSGSPISYTDGLGTVGSGTLEGTSVDRGDEHLIAKPNPPLAMAVAPPRSTERARFVVEKLAELGLDRLEWLQTTYGEGRPLRAEKAQSWAQQALEQSRGGWLMVVSSQLTRCDSVQGSPALWVATRGSASPPRVVEGGIMLVGPEAGFSEEEIPNDAVPVGLGSQVLRTETAAVVGATLLLDRSGRLQP